VTSKTPLSNRANVFLRLRKTRSAAHTSHP